MLIAHVEYLEYKMMYRDTSFFHLSSRKKLYWLTPTIYDFVLRFIYFAFYSHSKYSDFSSESPWNRNTRLCSTLRASRCEESEFLTFIFHVGDRSRHLGTLFRFCWVVALPMAWDPSPGCLAAVFNQRNRVLADHARRESRQ